jgi:hypothetical protein
VTDGTEPNPLKERDCYGVTDENPSDGEREDHSCRQCGGAFDVTEQKHVIAGRTAWLHPECRRFYVEDRGS